VDASGESGTLDDDEADATRGERASKHCMFASEYSMRADTVRATWCPLLSRVLCSPSFVVRRGVGASRG
jgi:hypothetical protein